MNEILLATISDFYRPLESGEFLPGVVMTPTLKKGIRTHHIQISHCILVQHYSSGNCGFTKCAGSKLASDVDTEISLGQDSKAAKHRSVNERDWHNHRHSHFEPLKLPR